MPRRPRLHVANGCYHVVLRGNHREPLFGTAADRAKLDAIVADVITRFDARVHAYCWMTNHLHALVQIGERPLEGLMQRIAMRYSRYRHKVLDTTGHLFERRYGAWLVDVDAYFTTLLRYIHLNPVKAGMVADPAEYPWSSHRAYLGTEFVEWVTVDLGLSLFGADAASARASYEAFVHDAGGCQSDLAAEPGARADSRVLGDESFVEELQRSACRPAAPDAGAQTLEELAAEVCAARGISVELLRSRSSARRLTPARLELLRRALEQGAANLTEVGRYLGRSPSTLCKLAARAR